MTKLLVSVRDPQEALAALDGGADLIDVKEPHRGALGAADPEVVAAVVRTIAGRVPTSAALGELVALEADQPPASTGTALTTNYAKIGLSGCTRWHDWPRRWQAALSTLPDDIQRVAVVYADWESCGAPEPFVVLRHAMEIGCAAILIDTYEKTRGGLVDLWSLAYLARYLAAVRSECLLAVVAGSLQAPTLASVAALRPDYVAVRGAVCRGDRTGTVDSTLVRRLADILATCAA
jgi:uncharacterized protein (UPF0264 family)